MAVAAQGLLWVAGTRGYMAAARARVSVHYYRGLRHQYDCSPDRSTTAAVVGGEQRGFCLPKDRQTWVLSSRC